MLTCPLSWVAGHLNADDWVLTPVGRDLLVFGRVQVLHEVKQHQVAGFVSNQDLGPFSVLITANDIVLEEVIPGVCSFQAVCVIELNFLPLDCKQKVFPRFDEKQIYIVLIFEAEDGTTLLLFQGVDVEDIDRSLIAEAHDVCIADPDHPHDLVTGSHVSEVYLLQLVQV